MQTMKSHASRPLEERLIARTWEDDKFREELLRSPRAVIEREVKNELGANAQLPENLEVHVHQQTRSTYHLVLPMRIDAPAQDEMWDLGISAQAQSSSNTICGICGTSCSGCQRTCVR